MLSHLPPCLINDDGDAPASFDHATSASLQQNPLLLHFKIQSVPNLSILKFLLDAFHILSGMDSYPVLMFGESLYANSA
jgi:hypothetical protein